MLAIDEEKLPPPTPAIAATMTSVVSETPGFSTNAVAMQGTMRSNAENTVQLRPPKRATAKVYGIRMSAPTAVGTVVSMNFSLGVKPYAGPRKRTKADHMLQMQKPMCSDA